MVCLKFYPRRLSTRILTFFQTMSFVSIKILEGKHAGTKSIVRAQYLCTNLLEMSVSRNCQSIGSGAPLYLYVEIQAKLIRLMISRHFLQSKELIF